MTSREQIRQATERLDAELAERLLAARAAVDAKVAEANDARVIQAAVIDEAIADGWSHARIGGVLGISKQRVGQLRQLAGDGEQ